jgi:hypothetical protein
MEIQALAGLYLDMGRYEEAEALYRRELAIEEKLPRPRSDN